MLVVANERTVRVGGEGRLAGTGQAEEERDVAVGSFVGGRMERELTELDGLQVVLRPRASGKVETNEVGDAP